MNLRNREPFVNLRLQAVGAWSWVLVLVLLAVLAVATGAAADEPPACISVTVSADVPSSVVFVDGFETGGIEPWIGSTSAFSATEILDIVFEADFVVGFNGDALLELKVYTPNGHLYQVLVAPVSSEPSKRGSRVRVAGFPYPLPTQIVAKTIGELAAPVPSMSLPVAGTQIVATSLYGTWEVRPYLSGQAADCGERTFFSLVQ